MMEEMNFEQYERELIDYIHSNSKDDAISSLSDADISYLLTLWDEYLDTLDLDEEAEYFDIDEDELYEYLNREMERDGMKINLSIDLMIKLIEFEEEFVDNLYQD